MSSPAMGQHVAHFIQAGAYQTATEAQHQVSELNKKYSPVTVHDSGDGTHRFKVWVGNFQYYADAYSFRSEIPRNELEGAFITSSTVAGFNPNYIETTVSVDETGLAESDPRDKAAWELGGFEALPSEEEVATIDERSDNPDELLQLGLRATKDPRKSAAALERFVDKFGNHPSARKGKLTLARVYGRGENPVKAERLLNEVMRTGNGNEKSMARFLMGHVKLNNGKKHEAAQSFRSLASDRQVPAGIRREALRRAAGASHSQGKHSEAWIAFRQLERNSIEPHKRAEAQLQLAGLAFELVNRGKGSWDEVRALCQSVMENRDAAPGDAATARLMRLETYYFERKFDKVLAETEQLADTFSATPREYYMAILWRGIALTHLRRYDEAKPLLISLGHESIDPEDKFARAEPQARAALYLVIIGRNSTDESLKSEWANFIRDQFPDSEEATILKRLEAQ